MVLEELGLGLAKLTLTWSTHEAKFLLQQTLSYIGMQAVAAATHIALLVTQDPGWPDGLECESLVWGESESGDLSHLSVGSKVNEEGVEVPGKGFKEVALDHVQILRDVSQRRTCKSERSLDENLEEKLG
ncbi:hypothetical protein BT96DRAFT_939680 [Gymnopus androsaceus JB14]|uniref:Uncharacterized protein n=1 Tax=Gymnopus androsaceus JB14 TaxID=1447944 RepID=A0A6A4HLW5_9AGAR|nr:hypothetical protein BT96DRAFT_939680 [Gymnopus androsaceus JB14]